MAWEPTIQNCDNYMSERQGKFEYRAVRYKAAADWMKTMGLNDNFTVVDVGAGWTEFDYYLRTRCDWRGRYIPIDGGIDGTDLYTWVPKRQAHFFVGLEIIEHLTNWERLVSEMKAYATRGVCLSTPNPETTDVLGMDPTHVRAVHAEELERLHFEVSAQTFYGGAFSNGQPDSLFATWYRY